MEIQSPREKTSISDHSGVDTSHPFRSVKEAVALFGDRILADDTYSRKPYTSPKQETTRQPVSQLSLTPLSLSQPKRAKDGELGMVDMLKKLEAELEETKRELKLLKEKNLETDIALASLNAQLHRNMSKMAMAEAAAATNMVTTRALVVGGYRADGITEKERKGDRREKSSLAQMLNLGNKEDFHGATRKQRKKRKKKPIIPLVGNFLFSWKKSSSTTLDNSLYTSSQAYQN